MNITDKQPHVLRSRNCCLTKECTTSPNINFSKAAHGQAQAQLTSAYKLFGPDIAGPNFVLLTCTVKSSQSAARELVGFRCKYIGVNGPKDVGPSASF